MRTLNDYFIMGGNMTAIQTANNPSPVVVIPDGGKLEEILLNPHTVIGGTAVTFDIMVNGADSGIDATLAASTVDETTASLTIGGDINLFAGDALNLLSNGEQAAATTADLTYIVRRMG
tara:strand:- start:3548 stop:3904 length:357 start_codon:yes stop_codon:yes gene_type:complete